MTVHACRPSRIRALGLAGVLCGLLAAPVEGQSDLSDSSGVVSGPTHQSLPGDERSSMWSSESLDRRFRRLCEPEEAPEPSIAEVERPWMAEAIDLANAGDVDAAIGRIHADLGRDASAMSLFLLGTFEFGAGRLEEAAVALERCVERAPTFTRAWMQLGLTLVQLGRFEPARRALAEAFSLGATDATTSGLLAYASSNAGRHLAAEEAYRRTIILDAATLDWKRGLILTFFTERRFAEAAAMLGRLSGEDPDNPDWWMFQANAALGLRRPHDAARNFEIVTALGGATAESLGMLANIYVNDGLSSLAVDRYLASLEASGLPDPRAAFQASQLMLRRNEVDEADRLLAGIRACCFEGFDRDQRKRQLKLEAAVAVRRQDADGEALVLERLVALDAEDGESMILLGEYHARRPGGFAEAASWYEKAAKVPEHAARACFQHGQLLAREGRLAEAIPYLDRSLEIESRASVRQYRDRIADYVARTGRG